MGRKCGVYQILCQVDGRCYIGSSTHLKARMAGHKSLLKRGEHHNDLLQKAWNEHGPDVFLWTVLEECSKEDRHAREFAWVKSKGVSVYNFHAPYRDGRQKAQTVPTWPHWSITQHATVPHTWELSYMS